MTFFFLVFTASFFLKLGADTLEHPPLRIGYLIFLGLGLISLLKKERLVGLLKSPTAVLFLAFFAFQLVRLSWALWQITVRGLESSITLPLHLYVASPVTWLLYLGFFAFAFLLFRSRSQTQRLLWTLGTCAFVLALTALPPLIQTGTHGYVGPDGKYAFFPPFVYFHDIVTRYLVSKFAHPNYVGDVVALGFFPALGLFLYSLQHRSTIPPLALSGLLVATEGLAIILFFSRATIVCFAIAFLIFLTASLIKYPSRAQFVFAAAAFLLVAAFLLWTGDIQGTWKELQTLEVDLDAERESSFTSNREGAKRAVRIFQTFPLWGVGSEGYARIAGLYATPGVEHYFITNYLVLCHYLQVLAEEGSGAFLYLLALLIFFMEATAGLLRAKSRFQFMAGLSLLMTVSMILVHASVKPVMEFFAIAMPVYILMGAALAILNPDFGQE